MITRKFIILTLLTFISEFTSAQENPNIIKRCGTSENLNFLLLKNPTLRDSIKKTELNLQKWIKNKKIKKYEFNTLKNKSVNKSANRLSDYPLCGYNNTYFTTVNSPDILNEIVNPPALNCVYGGEFVRVLNLEEGNTYRISTVGLNNFDTQITIYSENGGEILAYNDDTQNSLQSEIYFTPFITGNYDILINEYECMSNTLCSNLEIELWYKPRPVITIPVVIHIIHKGEDEGVGTNISNEQIQSQIDALNKDFRRLNSEVNLTDPSFRGTSMDTRVEFCLAKQDPDGYATTGIMRYQELPSIAYEQFGFPLELQCLNKITMEYILKPNTIWDRDNYLNIWVSDLNQLPPFIEGEPTGELGCGFTTNIFGYAQFPNMPGLSPSVPPESTDGVWVNYKAFGTIGDLFPSYNLGKTATHEIGHWLNLKHIWGDDQDLADTCSLDDLVIDTPLQTIATYGCNTFPILTDNCTSLFPGIMFMNFMDYSDDACLSMFTYGQFVRMDGTLFTSRASLLSSEGCNTSSLDVEDYSLISSFAIYPNPTNSIVNFDNSKTNFETLEIYNLLGQSLLKVHLDNLNQSNINISEFDSGVYTFKFMKQGMFKTVKVIKN